MPVSSKSPMNRTLTVGYRYQGEKQIPALQLSGNWMDKAGFGIQRKVSVQVQSGWILIQGIDRESEG